MLFNYKRELLWIILFQSVVTTGYTPYKKPGGENVGDPGGPRGRRDLSGLGSLHDISFLPGLDAVARLERRQEPSCTCPPSADVFYPMNTTSSYMATPYGPCDIAVATSYLCPIDYYCACQPSASGMCLPTALEAISACTSYTGPTTRSSVTRWFFASVPTNLAEISGQCGGSTQTQITSFWASTMTLCPVTQACVCETSGSYSKCVDNDALPARGTACPADPCSTIKQEFSVSLPPPHATAKLGERCGGKCWRGPTNCPSGASCFTETSPTPGAYAECATANPGSRLRARSNERFDIEGINVPVKAQAIATRIYF
ncbi:hypothetical protein AOL_s00043g194 [Orbilia oligospora ATCC 24927]|uniref:CBM1 domain-containing protein n=1 Tax=Arthrobotrys oligospora (strain ATCC 24927 / CBS 115.81 / DSM 1491) TaxID=756982 RepID=G1X3C1_ARTOA|nr:hypothetical protein AOL_s00043g194 [Orbilia oligospora ATCC 24927]EGX52405.1 hypothetical protein AOL_s00043g194 [Orbilia oligospora ATCC 24927]